MKTLFKILAILCLLTLPVLVALSQSMIPVGQSLLVGQVLTTVPSAGGGGVVATDNFTRADAGTLGANWTMAGANSLSIVSSNAAGVGVVNQGDFWSANSFHNDQYSTITINDVGGSHYAYAGVRLNSSFNGYILCCNYNSWSLQVFTAGSGAVIDSGLGTFNAGDVMKISITGTTIICTQNGSVLTTKIDSTWTTGSAGVGGYGVLTISNWVGGNND